MAEALSSGDTVKFTSYGMGAPVRIVRLLGTKVRVSLLSGKDVHESFLGQPVEIENPWDLPHAVKMRHGLVPPQFAWDH